jgi:hypothetical protein
LYRKSTTVFNSLTFTMICIKDTDTGITELLGRVREFYTSRKKEVRTSTSSAHSNLLFFFKSLLKEALFEYRVLPSVSIKQNWKWLISNR